MIQAVGLQEAQLSMQENELNKVTGIDLKDKNTAKLMEAAKQFEAVFTNQLFNAMEATVNKDEDSMFSGGRGEEMFKSMFYDELAKSVATDPATSFGFAKQIYEQMKDRV